MKNPTLRIKSHFSIIPHTAQQVELRSGIWNPTAYVIYDESKGDKLYSILKDLNGQLTVKEMAAKYQISRSEMEGILDHLHQLDVLESTTSYSIDDYRDQLVLEACQPSSHLDKILIIGEEAICHDMKKILVNVCGENAISTLNIDDSLINKIRSQPQTMFDNFVLQEMAEQCFWWKEYFVVLALTQNDPVLAMRVNQINYLLEIPWIHGVIDGPFVFVGPMFSAQSGPCYHCFEKRICMNLREYASYQRYKEMLMEGHFNSVILKKTIPTMHLLSSHLAMEVINYRYFKMCFTKSKALSIYLPTMEICFNEVMRLSGCRVCGAVPHRDDQQLYYDYQTMLENVQHG